MAPHLVRKFRAGKTQASGIDEIANTKVKKNYRLINANTKTCI